MLTTRLGWFGAVAYALPILEVWLLTRLSEDSANVMLIALQVVWVVALIGVTDRCVRGSRAFRAAGEAAKLAAAEEAVRAAEPEEARPELDAPAPAPSAVPTQPAWPLESIVHPERRRAQSHLRPRDELRRRSHR